MVVRFKSPGKVKARMCIRGDMVNSRVRASSPTPNRSCLRSFLGMGCALNLQFAMVDVSQAFVQSANVAHHERFSIQPPEFVLLPWKRKLAWTSSPNAQRGEHFFIMLKPLYGLRESPLRWLIHISETLRLGKFRQGRIDICTFRLVDPKDGEIICILLTYVDDILISYRRDGLGGIRADDFRIQNRGTRTTKCGIYDAVSRT